MEQSGNSDQLHRKEGNHCPPGSWRRWPQLLTFPGGLGQRGAGPLRITVYRPGALALASGQMPAERGKRLWLVSIHSLDDSFDHHGDHAACVPHDPPGGVRVSREREGVGGRKGESKEAGWGTAGFSSAVLGLASCPLAHGNPPDLIVRE